MLFQHLVIVETEFKRAFFRDKGTIHRLVGNKDVRVKVNQPVRHRSTTPGKADYQQVVGLNKRGMGFGKRPGLVVPGTSTTENSPPFVDYPFNHDPAVTVFPVQASHPGTSPSAAPF